MYGELKLIPPDDVLIDCFGERIRESADMAVMVGINQRLADKVAAIETEQAAATADIDCLARFANRDFLPKSVAGVLSGICNDRGVLGRLRSGKNISTGAFVTPRDLFLSLVRGGEVLLEHTGPGACDAAEEVERRQTGRIVFIDASDPSRVARFDLRLQIGRLHASSQCYQRHR